MPILSLIITLIFYKITGYDFFILLSIISLTSDSSIIIYRYEKKFKKILKKYIMNTKDKAVKDR